MLHGAGTDGRDGSFVVTGMSPDVFVEAARRALVAMDLPVRVSVSLDGGQLVVAVDRLGTSILRYDVNHRQDGFTVQLRSRRIAPLHRPFSHEFEERVARVLDRVAVTRDPVSTR